MTCSGVRGTADATFGAPKNKQLTASSDYTVDHPETFDYGPQLEVGGGVPASGKHVLSVARYVVVRSKVRKSKTYLHVNVTGYEFR